MPIGDSPARAVEARSREFPEAGLVEEWTRAGNWLFRWRSYLPLAVLASLVVLSYTFPPVTAGQLDGWELAGLAGGLAGPGVGGRWDMPRRAPPVAGRASSRPIPSAPRASTRWFAIPCIWGIS